MPFKVDRKLYSYYGVRVCIMFRYKPKVVDKILVYSLPENEKAKQLLCGW